MFPIKDSAETGALDLALSLDDMKFQNFQEKYFKWQKTKSSPFFLETISKSEQKKGDKEESRHQVPKRQSPNPDLYSFGGDYHH